MQIVVRIRANAEIIAWDSVNLTRRVTMPTLRVGISGTPRMAAHR